MSIKKYIGTVGLLISVLVLNSCTNSVQAPSIIDAIPQDMDHRKPNRSPKSKEDLFIQDLQMQFLRTQMWQYL